MPHLYPVVIPGGQSVRGASLGFHAYSLRVDNLSNQWLQEQSTLAWIPPYSLGTCLRMYGCAVALILNASPTGQPQLQPIAGEYAAGFFSDEYRTEVAGVPVRQFTLVQTVSDLTEGPEPAFPPVGVCRIWADSNGVLHHVHSDGTDATVIDTHTALAGVLTGFLPNPGIGPLVEGNTAFRSTGLGGIGAGTGPGAELLYDTNSARATFQGFNRTASTYLDLALSGRNILFAPQSGGVVIPNLDYRNAQIQSSKAATGGAGWTNYNFQLDLPAPPAGFAGTSTWLIWWTAHFQDASSGPYPFQVETNLWTWNGAAIVAEVGARQWVYMPISGGGVTCTGFGLVTISSAQSYVLASAPVRNITLSPPFGGAFSRITALRIG